MQADARWAFARYRAIAHHLPTASRGFPPFSAPVPDLSAVIARYDGFILDAFGVLNIGGTAIPGAVERIAQPRHDRQKPLHGLGRQCIEAWADRVRVGRHGAQSFAVS